MADVLPSELSGLLHAEAAAREAAWTAFLETHSRLLLHIARAVGRDYDAAMDGYAYLLEQLRKDDFRRLRAYAADGRSKFTTWLVVVARRLCLDFHRQRYGRARSSSRETIAQRRGTRRRLTDLLAEEIDVAAMADPSGDDPESALLAGEQTMRLEAVLQTLEPGDRLLLKLRFEDDLSAREIGEVMGFPTPFHVYRRLNGTLAALRARLGEGKRR